MAAVAQEADCGCILHGVNLIHKNGSMLEGHLACKDRLVLLLFSSNWCEPCHVFTKMLSHAINGLDKHKNDVLCVLIPIEENEEQSTLNFATLPSDFLMVHHTCDVIKVLQEKFSVRITPKLVVCKPNGQVISLKGRTDVENKGTQAFYIWWEAMKSRIKPLAIGESD